MGIEGAAIATVIGQWVGAAVALGLNAVANHEVHLTLKGFQMSGKTIWSIYKVGLPTILTQAMGAVVIVHPSNYKSFQVCFPFFVVIHRSSAGEFPGPCFQLRLGFGVYSQ